MKLFLVNKWFFHFPLHCHYAVLRTATVREKSGNFFDFIKVSEKSGNLLVKTNAFCTKSSQKGKKVEEEKNINGGCQTS